MNYQHVMECKGSLPFTARHWPLSWARWIHSIFASLSIQNTQHQPTFTPFWGQVQLVHSFMHCPHGENTQNGTHIAGPCSRITSGDVAAANNMWWWHMKKSSADAKSLRDECMVHLMQHEGSVPWQEKCQLPETTCSEGPRISFSYGAVHSGSHKNGGGGP
jgi:hypothetical protein